MTNEILKTDWKGFCDRMSREKFAWQTKIEVFKDDIGAQILSNNLLLKGLVYEEKPNGENFIEIMVGGKAETAHQTHTVSNPTKITFLENDAADRGSLEIQDADGAKTLIECTPSDSVEYVYMEEAGIVAGFI